MPKSHPQKALLHRLETTMTRLNGEEFILLLKDSSQKIEDTQHGVSSLCCLKVFGTKDVRVEALLPGGAAFHIELHVALQR